MPIGWAVTVVVLCVAIIVLAIIVLGLLRQISPVLEQATETVRLGVTLPPEGIVRAVRVTNTLEQLNDMVTTAVSSPGEDAARPA